MHLPLVSFGQERAGVPVSHGRFELLAKEAASARVDANNVRFFVRLGDDDFDDLVDFRPVPSNLGCFPTGRR